MTFLTETDCVIRQISIAKGIQGGLRRSAGIELDGLSLLAYPYAGFSGPERVVYPDIVAVKTIRKLGRFAYNEANVGIVRQHVSE